MTRRRRHPASPPIKSWGEQAALLHDAASAHAKVAGKNLDAALDRLEVTRGLLLRQSLPEIDAMLGETGGASTRHIHEKLRGLRGRLDLQVRDIEHTLGVCRPKKS